MDGMVYGMANVFLSAQQMMGNSVSQQREFYARHRMETARQFYNGLHYEHQYHGGHGRLVQREHHGHYFHEDEMRVATIQALKG